MDGGFGNMWVAADLGGMEMLQARFDRRTCPRHSHDTYAIGGVRGGVNRFHYRGASHDAVAGMICTVTIDEVHTCDVPVDEGMAYRCIYPSAGQLAEAAAEMAGRPVAWTLALPPVIDDPVAFRLLDRLFDAQLAAAPVLSRQSLLFAVLARLIALHAERRVGPDAARAGTQALARARDYLHENIEENVSLSGLAEVAGIGPFRLLRGFAKAYGLPPHAYLTQLRVRRAKALIAGGTKLAEAAAASGFADQSHMARHFKRIVGVTPGRYREAPTPSPALASPRPA